MTQNDNTNYLHMTYFLTWCWSGLIIGVSFIATPAKFLATTSSKIQLLEVGKVTFNIFMYVEFLFAVLLIISMMKNSSLLLTYKILLSLIIGILFSQYFLLLPLLDERVTQLMQGLIVKPSNLHFIYVLAELSKLMFLLVLGIVTHKNTFKAKSDAII